VEDGRLARPIRKAAKEYSPRRKPWVKTGKKNKAPEGRKSNLIHDGKLWVAQCFQRCHPAKQNDRL
jgi:hypothetical protein